jgi:hypothetical protein
VDLDAIEARELGVFSSFFKTSYDSRDLLIAEFARDVVRFFAIGRVHLVVCDGKGAWGHWLCAAVEG